MPFPAGLTLVTVNCQFDLPPDGGASGTVRLVSAYPLLGPTDNSIVPPFTRTASLDEGGECTIEVPATNDPQWTPQDWAYAVRIDVGGVTVRGTLQLDYQTASVELSDLLQVDGAAEVGVTYATLAQLDALTGADLDIEIADVDDLQTQLDGKLDVPIEPYLTADDIDNLVSTESLTEALVPYARLVDLGVRAADHGLVGWTFDTTGVQAGTVQPTAGLAQVARVRAQGSTITNILLHFTSGGSALTSGQCFAALYTDAGALLAASADQATAWAGGGLKTCALTAPQAVTSGAWYRVLWWFNGTTGPTISRGVNSSSAIVNAGMTAPTLRYSTANTGLTTTPPANIGTQTGGATAWWVGVS